VAIKILKVFWIIYILTCIKTFPNFIIVQGQGWSFSGVCVIQSLVFCVMFCRSLLVFSGVRVTQSLVFYVVFCRSLFVFSRVRVTQSLVFCVVFCRSLFVFSGVCVTQSSVFYVVFCRSLFVPFSFLCWPLYWLSFSLWLLITPLTFSNISSPGKDEK